MAVAAGQQASMLAGAVRHSCGLYWDALGGRLPLAAAGQTLLMYRWNCIIPDTPPDMGVLYSALREAPAAEQQQA